MRPYNEPRTCNVCKKYTTLNSGNFSKHYRRCAAKSSQGRNNELRLSSKENSYQPRKRAKFTNDIHFSCLPPNLETQSNFFPTSAIDTDVIAKDSSTPKRSEPELTFSSSNTTLSTNISNGAENPVFKSVDIQDFGFITAELENPTSLHGNTASSNVSCLIAVSQPSLKKMLEERIKELEKEESLRYGAYVVVRAQSDGLRTLAKSA